MSSIVLAPLDAAGPAIELASGLWRKRVLPVGDIDYKGRQLHFTAPYLASLAEAFSQRAYDQVPFQLADSGNGHTNDPERFRGQVVDLRAESDGLYAVVSTTDAGGDLLRMNPQLGVSARIVEDYRRADGAYYPAAVQHVLGTLDPRITSLGPWEPIDMAGTYESVLDLSSYDWAEPDDDPYAAAVDDVAAAIDADLDSGALSPEEAEAMAAWAYDGEQELAYVSGGALPEPAELANDYPDAIELAAQRETVRLAEDAAEFGGQRRGSTESRLAAALERVARGTYVPPAPGALQFAAGTDHGRALARMRWERQPDESAAVGIGPICGAPDQLGRCAEPYHSRDCSSLADMGLLDSPQLRAAMAERVRSPYPVGGRLHADQYGSPLDLTGLIETATGERLGGPSWADRAELGMPDRRETLQAQRQDRFADTDDPDDGGYPVPKATADLALMIRQQDPSLRVHTAREARSTGQRRQAEALALAASQGRLPRDPDSAFDMSGRRARMREQRGRVTPLAITQPDDGLQGLPQYTAGQL